MLAALLFLIIGFSLGYIYRGTKSSSCPQTTTVRRYQAPLTHQQKLYLKSMHQTESDRIRELNKLSSHQSTFLRLLKQTFFHFEIAVKDNRFIVLDRDHFPLAIFEYRDGTQPIKLVDQEDGLPLHLYKALISSDELKKDYASIISTEK
ncbi:hypothetical protein A3K93_07765 [Acinetobacter sp. NCu2D-2]|uniref:hypothetical protein n=1 Tax=Acinetobacter sp. NCu2D-2 TaxID=1608473 RepID=UPI0007CDB4AA|nr:hypothetical protein [Acinetobacter sp. NCu2D-2]ANF82101.1 hypothetical protein A3K93_07765 [Acinetobacter sp. NCu2D-2]